jgi:putative ABC transport system permease protein
LRFGFRLFAKNRTLTGVAVMSLALGIAACSTIFSVMNAFIFRPLPFPDPDRLVLIQESFASEKGAGTRSSRHSTILQWRKASETIEKVGGIGFGVDQVTLAGIAEADRVTIQYVDNGLFEVLGVEPMVGRRFLPDEGGLGSSMVILSHDLWQRAFDGNREVIGTTARIDGEVCTIVGVMPPGFWVVPGQSPPDVWRAANFAATPNVRWLMPLARLKPGVTAEQAQAEAAVSIAEASEDEIQAGTRIGARVEPYKEALLGRTRSLFYFLLALTSPTCCSRKEPRASAKWRCGRRWGRGGGA